MGSTETSTGGQVSDLPPIRRFITTHDDATGKAKLYSQDEGQWQSLRNASVAFNVAYTTTGFPPSLNDDADITAYKETMASGDLGLVNPNGTVCRYVDFGPGSHPVMHRTQSLDYGILLEGSIEMMLDSGEVHTLRRGDVAVQRATMHAWRNPSDTEWARMIFMLQDCQPIKVGGTLLEEDIRNATEVPASRKDH
ncbi:hypothetical protein NA57DRAFT_32624 [Rhizodiscina lignyota]|uniref:Cupin type-2 domain-containing protein n=1 Tax=Rhizodiscina lignyota TaxID=1504668 RepID=A0A9P4IJX3_9PEZI|nr:hypothetical protein NA57DRAFT_32624 [Rhizodiscina lignyota]